MLWKKEVIIILRNGITINTNITYVYLKNALDHKELSFITQFIRIYNIIYFNQVYKIILEQNTS